MSDRRESGPMRVSDTPGSVSARFECLLDRLERWYPPSPEERLRSDRVAEHFVLEKMAREREAVRIGLDLDYGAITEHQARAWLLANGWALRPPGPPMRVPVDFYDNPNTAIPTFILSPGQDPMHRKGVLWLEIASDKTAGRILYEMALLPRGPE